MQPHQKALTQLLRSDKTIALAYFDNPKNPTTLHIHNTRTNVTRVTPLPEELRPFKIAHHTCKPITKLTLPAEAITPFNDHQACQDEPIELGTQIQPRGADWLGTAGSPCRWTDADGKEHWGILSNWHVMADGGEYKGRSQHQPTTARSAIASLDNWTPVNPNVENCVDAAIADALINGQHTISHRILGLGNLGQSVTNAAVGLAVAKAGRTTGVTNGRCIAVGAAANVGYGDFVATFVDQDVFEADQDEFSAPGDSGSLIVCAGRNCPVALLFAGNSELTIGNPMRLVQNELDLVYPFI